jgi:uncharacterized protein (DUF433 family)
MGVQTGWLRLQPKSAMLVGMEHQDHEMSNALPLVSREHISVAPGYCGGKPHIAGHRIKVQHIVIWHERQGKSPEEIAADYDGLTLGDVHAALAYYYDHRNEIDADLLADERFVEQLKAASPPSLLLQRLGAAHAPNDSLSPR